MKLKEFITRTITAFVLIIIAYVLIQYVPPKWFSLLLYFVICVGAHELVKLTKPATYSMTLIFLHGLIVACYFTLKQPDLALGMMIILVSTGIFFLFSTRQKEKLPTFVRDIAIHFLTIFYLYLPLYYMFELKQLGPNYLFFLIFVIAVGDSGAYFVGSAIGKTKIYPVASPNKSLEGLIAAIITAGLTGWLCLLVFPVKVDPWIAVGTAALIGLFSQLSDPIESLFKRAAGQKDSGNILPGHGGILDRVDSYIFCAPVLFYIIKYLWS